MCLDVAYARMYAAPVVQGTCWGGANQMWTLVPTVTAGRYTVRALHSGMCLDVADASMSHAAPVVQATCVPGTLNQTWTLVATGGGGYTIRALHGGMCLDVAYASKSHAAPVVQGTCWGGANQSWTLN